MRALRSSWAPVAALALGCLLLLGVRAQTAPELRGPLHSALPTEFGGLAASTVTVPQDEAELAAFTEYAFRVYQRPVEAGVDPRVSWVSAYVGYYDQQTQGRTIHSPRNCLPGGGWEILSARPQTLEAGGKPVTVNRVILQNEGEQALVLYWYQGRGRVAHNEYLVKWDLLRDAILRRRTDEALVRVVVPVEGSEETAFEAARDFATRVMPRMDGVLPAA